ncbi:MAG: DUF4249 domain-containing protein [Bacteroidetes bacterium]|nr:MAG: DUF4249 domain-containing protein [Bacteroidota bacterium]
MKRILFLFLFAIVLTACEKRDIPTQNIAYQSKLVVNSLFDNENAFRVFVSKSESSLSGIRPQYLSNAEVLLFKNNVFIDTLDYDLVDNYYFTSEVAEVGAQYSVRVKSAGSLQEASAMATLPNLQNFGGLTYTDSIGVDGGGLITSQLNLNFTDFAGQSNYYRLSFLYFSPATQSFLPFDFDTDDEILLNPGTIHADDGSYLFSDALFTGRTRNITIRFPQITATGTPRYAVKFEALSEEAYRYITTLEQFQAQQSTNSPFQEPVLVFSNIQNGVGIFAGSTIARDTIY